MGGPTQRFRFEERRSMTNPINLSDPIRLADGNQSATAAVIPVAPPPDAEVVETDPDRAGRPYRNGPWLW